MINFLPRIIKNRDSELRFSFLLFKFAKKYYTIKHVIMLFLFHSVVKFLKGYPILFWILVCLFAFVIFGGNKPTELMSQGEGIINYTNSILFLGIIALIIYFAVLNFFYYLLNRDIAFAYYSGYLFSGSIFFALKIGCHIKVFPLLDNTLCYLDQNYRVTVIGFLNLFYFLFSVNFLKIGPHNIFQSSVTKKIRTAIYFIILSDQVLVPLGYKALSFKIYLSIGTPVLLFTIYFWVHLLKYSNPLTRLFFGANSVFIINSFIVIYLYYTKNVSFDYLSLNPATYIGTGILLENFFFTLGLNYRSKLFQEANNELQQQLIEELKERNRLNQNLQNVRNNIAADLHDDLGSGLSTIRLLGERAQIGIENFEKKNQIQKITQQASELIEKMSTIIWAMNSQNDTVDGLVNYLRRYAFDYLQETHELSLEFRLPTYPPSVSETILTGETRREVFLVFKEALHNIVKHAQTNDVFISVSLKDSDLEIKIKDNGKGFTNTHSSGNGLKNMEKRMTAIGAIFSFFSENGVGTTVILSLPLNKS